ncbi:hypothetical protein ANCCAN_06056 [Ancylostoma caninum]|uniref:Troponin T family protein n=1 Tax=Ancylostoma caninum TaxID=29170 RepID=A0A368GU15_ANCCA|nr:hypothetical protein ANCCAN_06056 [Ancylostoma caninum]
MSTTTEILRDHIKDNCASECKRRVKLESIKPSNNHHFDHGEHAENEEGLTEGEMAMLAAKRRHEEEDKAKLENYEERRKKEREAEEEELRMLKEKQERRRLEREQEEKEMAERKRLEEERRKKEEEDRRARLEEERRKKEEEKNKRQQMNFAGAPGGRNFVIPTKVEKNDKFGNIVQAKQEMGMTKDQQEEAKKVFLVGIRNGIPEGSSIAPDELKAKIKELHQRICKLETDKYDLEKRHERQEYDLKELNERSRQVARNSNGNKVADSSDSNSRFPPKVQILSKYDRQIDRRNFKERRSMYENKNAFPCFPGVPPPPTLFEKVFKKYDDELLEEEEAEEIEEYE